MTQQEEIVYSLPVWTYVAKKRSLHGIKTDNEDHRQYRTYLTRRLKKLRVKTDTKHGRGTKFNKHDYSVKVQKPLNEWKFVPHKADFLEYLLFQSERAWTYASELKTSNSVKDDSRIKIHSVKRLKKAVKYAQQLLDMTQFVKVDNSTLVEIEAYLHATRGNYAWEITESDPEQWQTALTHYSAALAIYLKLSEVAVGQEKIVYQSRCEALENMIRICKYNIGDESATIDLSTLAASKMDDVLQEKRKQQANTKIQIQIGNNQTVSIENEKMRILLVKIENLEQQITEIANSETFESRHLRLFDQLVFTFMEGEKLIQSDLQNPNLQASSIDNLKELALWINMKLVSVFVKRNVWIARNSLGEKQTNFVENKNLKPYDIVKILDTTMHRMRDSESFSSRAPYALLYFQTLRVLFLALAYYKRTKDAECHLLVQRGQELVKQLNSTKNNDSENLGLHLLPKIDTIQSELRKLAVIVRCQYAQKALNLSQQPEDVPESSKITTSTHVVQFPPAFASIACKPVFLDIAGSGIDYPEVPEEERVQATTTTTTKPTQQQTPTTPQTEKKGWFGLW
jgi:signal recognition particle subunit SRP68